MAILEDVRSLYNVGSIFRTADAAGLERLFLTGITGTPDHHRMRKTALGAERTVPWEYFASAQEAVRAARDRGFRVAVLEITNRPRQVETLHVDDYPICLVVGNEVTGVSEETVSLADFAIEIPQYGDKHSLNAAVAFGVAAFDIVRHHENLELQLNAGVPRSERNPAK